MSFKKLSQARDLFECCICKSEYNDPRLLKCGHSFCKDCLEHWSRERQCRNRRIVCPTCKEPTPLHAERGVEGLTKDYKVNQIKDAFSGVNVTLQRSTSGGAGHCEVCCDGVATFSCRDCKKSLCDNCEVQHSKTSLFRNHSVQPIAQENTQDFLQCEIHTSENAQYFCVTCNRAMCTLCAMQGEHQDHTTTSLIDGIQHCKNHLLKLLEPLQIQRQAVNVAMKDAKEIEREMERKMIRSKEVLQQVTDEMVGLIQDWEMKMSRMLQQRFDKVVKQREEYITDLKDSAEKIQNLRSSVSNIGQDSSNNMQIVSNYGRLMREFKQLTSNPPQGLELKVPTFKHNDSNELAQCLEKLSVISEDNVAFSNYDEVELPLQNKLLWQITQRGEDIGKILSPISVSFSHKQELIVSEVDSNRVQIFDNKGKPCGAISIQTPRDAVADKNGNIYIVNSDEPDVIVCNEEGVQRDNWGSDMFFQPRSVAVMTNGNIVVLDKAVCKVTVHTNDGQLLHSSDATELKSPVSVVTDSSNRILVADRDLNRIFVYSKICEALFSIIPSIQANHSSGTYVTSVCVDASDNIYVCLHESHKIIKYDPEGKFLKEVLTQNDGIHWPAGIAAGPNGFFAVVESKVPKGHSTLKLFKVY